MPARGEGHQARRPTRTPRPFRRKESGEHRHRHAQLHAARPTNPYGRSRLVVAMRTPLVDLSIHIPGRNGAPYLHVLTFCKIDHSRPRRAPRKTPRITRWAPTAQRCTATRRRTSRIGRGTSPVPFLSRCERGPAAPFVGHTSARPPISGRLYLLDDVIGRRPEFRPEE